MVTSNSGSVIVETSAEQVLPMLDIFDATMDVVVSSGYRAPGLLSTLRTADSLRYQRAAEERGARVLLPPREIVERIDDMIDREAIRGVQTEESLGLLQDAVDLLVRDGADSVVLGCTDLMLFGLDRIGHGVLPVIDSSAAHAAAAARLALRGR